MWLLPAPGIPVNAEMCADQATNIERDRYTCHIVAESGRAAVVFAARRLLSEGGTAAVGSDEPVVGSSEVCRLEERVRELERLLDRKSMENDILREALAKSRSKKPTLRPLLPPRGSVR